MAKAKRAVKALVVPGVIAPVETSKSCQCEHISHRKSCQGSRDIKVKTANGTLLLCVACLKKAHHMQPTLEPVPPELLQALERVALVAALERERVPREAVKALSLGFLVRKLKVGTK